MARNLLAFALLSYVAFATAGPPLQLEREPGSLFTRRSLGLHRPHFDESILRLDEYVVPISYNIYTIPVITDGAGAGFPQWSSPGRVTIIVTCKTVTDRITLHAAGITIDGVKVNDVTDATPVPVDVTGAFEEDLYHIDLTTGSLVVGRNYEIYIEKFTGEVRDTNNITPPGAPKIGLYRAEYTDTNDGTQKWLATTQFETIGFRRFCPGFDEPNFKATFELHIARSTAHNSYANSALEGLPGQPGDASTPPIPTGWVWDHYKPTVVTSSYLIAFVVSDFAEELSPGQENFRLPVGILGPPHLMNLGAGKYAANESAKILRSFESIFPDPSLTYPMHKMHSVAIPRDYFTFGAMENWGLNTYKDNLLLYYPEYSNEASRHQIASILSHELAHQWFGNRVTTKWWSNIWLNEGFATYMSFLGLKELPEYDPQRQIVWDAVQNALIVDAGASSHAVINEGTDEQVGDMSIFDSITYDKGCSLIWMMEGFLGKTELMNGLTTYLKDMSFKAAGQDDLFRNLQTVATDLPTGKTVQSIMETWTLKKGFPLVRVQRGTNSTTVYISQERFRNNVNTAPVDEGDELWEVPVAIAHPADLERFTNPKPNVWLEKDASMKPYHSETLDTSKWLIVNPETHGFYRVLYEPHFARLIQAQLEADHTVIPGISRGQLLDDYFRFAEQGYAGYESAFAFTKYLAKESDHAVWVPLLSILSRMIPHFTGSTVGPHAVLKGYLGPKIEGALNLIGWEQKPGDHGINVILRASLLDWACVLELRNCYTIAATHFDTWMAKPEENPIPIDLQSVLYCAGVAGSPTVFEFVLNKYNASLSNNQLINTETSRLVSALTCAQDDLSLLKLILGAIDGSNGIQKNHARTILEKVGQSSAGRAHAYGALTDNWKEIRDYFGGVRVIGDFVNAFTTYQNSAEDVAFIASLSNKIVMEDANAYIELQPSLSASLRKIQSNGLWLQNTGMPILQWMQANM